MACCDRPQVGPFTPPGCLAPRGAQRSSGSPSRSRAIAHAVGRVPCTARMSPGDDDAAGAARALLPGDGTHEDVGAAGRDLVEVVEVLDAIAVRAEEADVHIEGGRVAGIEADG